MKKFSLALLGMFLYLNDAASANEGHEQTKLIKRFAKKHQYGKLIRKGSNSPKRQSMSPWKQSKSPVNKKHHKQHKQHKSPQEKPHSQEQDCQEASQEEHSQQASQQ
jgi:hypothetical protein